VRAVAPPLVVVAPSEVLQATAMTEVNAVRATAIRVCDGGRCRRMRVGVVLGMGGG
jgi:hypothetical protein